jgi:hypothetical protein
VKRSSACTALLLASLIEPALAHAEGEPRADRAPSADLRGLYAPLHAASGLSLERAASPEWGAVTTQARLSYGYRPLTLRDPTGALAYSIVEHQAIADLGVSFGLARRATLGVDLPVLLAQGGDAWADDPKAVRLVGNRPLASSGLGDPALRAKLTLVAPELDANDVGEGLGLAIDERLTIPLGDERSLLGEGNLTSETRLLAEYGFGPLTVHARAGFKARGDVGAFACDPRDPIDACSSRFGHELPFGAGVILPTKSLGFDDEGRGTLFVETRGFLPIEPVAPFESAAPAGVFASVAGSVRVTEGVRLLAGVEAPMAPGVGSAAFRATFGVAFAPRATDVDRDGVGDNVDRCPEFAEDRDGFDDADGCPEADNDADGLADSVDACPDAPGSAGAASPAPSGCP